MKDKSYWAIHYGYTLTEPCIVCGHTITQKCKYCHALRCPNHFDSSCKKCAGVVINGNGWIPANCNYIQQNKNIELNEQLEFDFKVKK